jgi:hypothetical protein
MTGTSTDKDILKKERGFYFLMKWYKKLMTTCTNKDSLRRISLGMKTDKKQEAEYIYQIIEKKVSKNKSILG